MSFFFFLLLFFLFLSYLYLRFTALCVGKGEVRGKGAYSFFTCFFFSFQIHAAAGEAGNGGRSVARRHHGVDGWLDGEQLGHVRLRGVESSSYRTFKKVSHF